MLSNTAFFPKNASQPGKYGGFRCEASEDVPTLSQD
jgi:hypothetical protein